MNVRPGITTHLKYVRFKRRIGEPCALEYIIDLFAHCQADCRGENWGKVSDEYVEDVCRWEGPPGALYQALAAPFESKPGWVHRDEATNLIVTGWNEENRYLIRNWCANPNAGSHIKDRFRVFLESRLQMKLKLNPKDTTKAAPSEVPKDTTKEERSDQIRSDPIPLGEGCTDAPLTPSSPFEPPFEWEVKKAAATHLNPISHEPDPIPEAYASHYWRKKNERPESWFDPKSKRRINFAQQLENWWLEDRAQWEIKNGAVSTEDLEARLAKEKDPEKRRQLKEQIQQKAA